MKKHKNTLYLYFLLMVTHILSTNFVAQENQVKLKIEYGSGGSKFTLSPDGKILVRGGGNSISFWNVKTQQELEAIYVRSVSSLAISPDGKILAGVSENKIKFLEMQTGKEIRTLSGHSDSISSIAFSSDGKMLASGGNKPSIKIWDVETGRELKASNNDAYPINTVAFSPDGKFLAVAGCDRKIELWDVINERLVKSLSGHIGCVRSVSFSPDSKMIASGSDDATVRLWDVDRGLEIQIFGEAVAIESTTEKESIHYFDSIVFSLDGTKVAAIDKSGTYDLGSAIVIWNVESQELINEIYEQYGQFKEILFNPDGMLFTNGNRLWNPINGRVIKNLSGHANFPTDVTLSANGKMMAVSYNNDSGGTVKLWDLYNREKVKTLKADKLRPTSVAFNTEGNLLASSGFDWTINLWNTQNGDLVKTFKGHKAIVSAVSFSPNGKFLVSASEDSTLKLWNVATGTLIRTYRGHNGIVNYATFSNDGKILVSLCGAENKIKFWDVNSDKLLKSLDWQNALTKSEVEKLVPNFYKENKFTGSGTERVINSTDNKIIVGNEGNDIILRNVIDGKILCKLVSLDVDDWFVALPDGRFDTNKTLDNIRGVHWIINNEILNPLPLEIFIRQYFEPNLLQRVLAGEQFKQLPPISDINRVQPKVLIKDVKQVKDSADLINVTVEVESVTEDAGLSADDCIKKQKCSGVFDLRLFRDEQLVGVSAPQGKLEKFIKDAPRLVEETRKSGKLIDTPEDRAWREANDVFALTAENVRKISANKIEYVFRNVRLPKDGRESVEFKAYAFNADKVKSATTEPLKFSIPKTVSAEKKNGKAVLVSIGVNASENPGYDLRYAANDAREMQKIVGGNLLKEKGAKYSDVIQIPLVSDYKTEQFSAVNAAQKDIIKGVFALLSGKSYKDVLAEIKKINPKLAEEFQKIPNIEKLTQIDPEDTLVISFSGHGYADIAGIFYLLPFDIGADTTKLTAENLQKMISSDELSLWMQDITAAEMIMIIDACHSSAAVQGDGFKPGPMASRGLGQLAYDKDMKILSATQANNVALELGSLKQGLLSYALLQDGIINLLADTDKNGLFADEWLLYSEKRVPELYQEVKDGKREVTVDGKIVKTEAIKSGIYSLDGNQKSNLNLQQPSLFDFKRRKKDGLLFLLP